MKKKHKDTILMFWKELQVMYKQTPIEAANAVNLSLRFPHAIKFNWNYFPLKGGKKYRQYVKLKEHVEKQIKWLAILSPDELFRVKEAIQNELVPFFFKEIVDVIYKAKNSGSHIIEITIGDGVDFPLFEYESEDALDNPGIPESFQEKLKPGSVLMRTKTPKQPITQIPKEAMDILQKARIQPKGK